MLQKWKQWQKGRGAKETRVQVAFCRVGHVCRTAEAMAGRRAEGPRKQGFRLRFVE